MRLTHVTVRLKNLAGPNDAYEADFLVDPGATDSLAPAAELRKAGIQPVGQTAYELAGGRLEEYEFGLAEISFTGEVTAGRVIFGPGQCRATFGSDGLGIGWHHHRPSDANLKAIACNSLAVIVSNPTPTWINRLSH
jgi:hypothetical protein